MDRARLEVGQLHPMQPILHAAAGVVRPEVPGRHLADAADPEFDHAVPFQVGTGGDEPGRLRFQLRRRQWRAACMRLIPQTRDAIRVVAQRPVA